MFGGVAAFLPTDIAGLQLWYKPNDTSTLFQDAAKTIAAGNGDVVGAVVDKSGNAKDGTQATTARKATRQDGVINGKVVLRFDGADDFYNIGDLSSLTAAEIFIVVKIDADPPPDTTSDGLWDFGAVSAATRYPFATDSIIYDGFGSTARKTTVNPATSLTQFNLYNVVSISGEWTNFLNGTQLFTTATNTVGFNVVNTLGNTIAPTHLDGDIAEVILYNHKLSPTSKTQIKQYIANEYGLVIA
jgi:hypothetical protein